MMIAECCLSTRLINYHQVQLIIFQLVIILFQMGSTQSQENMTFLLDNYTVVKQQSNMKILQQKTTQLTYILKEESYIHRNQYDQQFKKLTIRDDTNSSQNILKLRKLWSKQHNGFCSHVFKIYSVYEYPQVKLIDQIDARRAENKYFEEAELISILQSCLNAINQEPRYTNLSPYLIFIQPEGLLKIINYALVDPRYRSIYNQHYYYSPQKFQKFHDDALQTSNSLQKQSVFNLGMTILHSGILQKLNKCYQLSSRRFNYNILNEKIEQLRQRYSFRCCQLIRSMLLIDEQKRIDLDQIQQLINQRFNDSSFQKQTFKQDANFNHLVQNQKIHIETNGSLLYSRDTYQKPPYPYYNIHTNIKGNQTSQIEFQLSNNLSLPKNHYILSRNKKTKDKNMQKENKNSLSGVMVKKQIEDSLVETKKLQSNMKNVNSEKIMIDRNNNVWQEQVKKSTLMQKNTSRCIFVIQTYEDKSQYQGMMQNNLKNGYGKLTYQDGVYFQGNFKNDNIDGKGVLYYGPNRPAYSGDWINNKFHGNGVLYNQFPVALNQPFDYTNFNNIQDFWIKFEGQFKDDIKEGKGKIYLSNGEMMDGTFCKGLLNGQGIYHSLNGQVKKIWSNNVML